MKLFYFIFSGVLLFGAAISAPAENENSYFARTWQAEDGLPDNRVVGLAQASDGYLWVATQGGIVRFDGVRFQRVSLPGSPDLIAGTLRGLLFDRMNRVWVAKEENDTLFCFDGTQMRTVTAEQGLPKNETQSSMAMDGKNDLWISYNTGKVVRYTHDGTVDIFTSTNGLPHGSGICWLASGRDGILWFAKGNQVGVFRNERFDVLKNFDSAALRIAAAHSGGIWVCAGRQIFKFNEGVDAVKWGEIISDKVGDSSSLDPSVLLEDREGAVWVGTVSAGLFHCNSNAVTKVKVSNPAILSLAEDREGDLWVGTRGGLNQVHRSLVSIIKSTDGLPFQGVQSVCQDATRALWLVGENGVLVRGQGTNWTVQMLPSGSVQPYATCVAADADGSIWIGMRGGILCHWINGKFNDVGLREKLHEKSVRSLLVMSNEDLWIGTDSPGVLYRLRGEKLQSFELPGGYRLIRAMAEDTSGNFWAGASDGLLVRVTGDTLVNETAKSSALSIRCLHGAANGDLWIGYAGTGAGRLRNGQITRFSTEQGLPNDYIAQILTDDRGSVWFGSNQGIFQVREQDFENVANGLAARVWPVIYGQSDGLSGLQASFDFWPSSARSSDGRLFFSMLSGLAEVRLDDARLNYQPPTVFIERVTDGDQTFASYQEIHLASSTNEEASVKLNHSGDKRELRLPPGLQQVQFEFTALSFVAPENVRFRYQLEGLDKNWVDAGQSRAARYTHPPPGRYHFKVTACNNDGIWNTSGDSLTVIVEPYYWETLWFKIVMTLTGIAVLYGITALMLRRRHRLIVQRLEHQHALELERNRIARDLHDDLGVGLTEIGLLGDLAGTGDGLPAASRQRLQGITERARSLAASLDEIVWAINPANDTSRSLMEYFFEYAQKLLERAGIRCRLEVIEPMSAGNLTTERRHQIFHAFKEALNNIIRHSNATEVQITLSEADGNLSVRVKDNGRGFETPGGEGSRNGLAGMRERLRRLGGRCEIVSAAGTGTAVTFIFPIKSKTRS